MKQLKGPELKVPPVLRDLFQDLRDRRLLPLLALVLVAIVAVPFLLSDNPEDEATSASPSLAVPQDQVAEAARLTVVEAKPGLRDYRKRLRAQAATNPFKQRYTKPDLEGAELQSESSTSGSSETTSTSPTGSSDGAAVVESPPSGGTGGNGNGAGDDGGKPPPLTLFTFVIDIKYSHTEQSEDGSVTMGESTKRERVKPYTPLPGEKAPVVTYLGVGAEAKTALLMVSKEVTATFGDGKCVSGTTSCELLEVEPGIPQTFEYGPNGVRYKINVLKIESLVAGHL